MKNLYPNRLSNMSVMHSDTALHKIKNRVSQTMLVHFQGSPNSLSCIDGTEATV